MYAPVLSILEWPVLQPVDDNFPIPYEGFNAAAY